MGRRTFTPEFKLEAIRLVTEHGYSVAQTCQALEVGETALRRWLKQYEAEQDGQTPSGMALTSEQRRIQELERQVRKLEQEREILKKATAFFAAEANRPTK